MMIDRAGANWIEVLFRPGSPYAPPGDRLTETAIARFWNAHPDDCDPATIRSLAAWAGFPGEVAVWTVEEAYADEGNGIARRRRVRVRSAFDGPWHEFDIRINYDGETGIFRSHAVGRE
jgi:hypothetical protein